MRSKALALSLVVITFLVSSPLALAQQTTQTSGEWSIVKAISTGEKLLVKMKNGKQFQGRSAGVSDTRLALSEGSKVTEIERDNIQKIYRLVSKSIAKSTGKATLIGAATGFGGGAGLGLVFGSYEDVSTAEAVGILGLLGAGIGAGIGAVSGLIASTRKQKILIYESK